MKVPSLAEITRKLKGKAEPLIIEQAKQAIPGEAKLQAVVDALAEDIDEALKLPWWAEPFDGPLIKAVGHFVVQFTYNELRDRGVV